METRRPRKRLDPAALWDYSLRLLGQRPYSSAELRKKLSERADSPPSVTAVLAKLREYGMADDGKFSETFASTRLANQGFGRMRVLRDLQAKRVAPSVAQPAVEKTFAGVDETDLARRFLERKYRGKNLPELLQDQKQLAGAYRRLRTAGFSGRVSLQALRIFSASAETMEEPPPED